MFKRGGIMEYKDKVFKRALEGLEGSKFSCNALLRALLDINNANQFSTLEQARGYREMFGFVQGDNDSGIDPFVQAINKHCLGKDEAFEFRVLLLSLAQVAWDDVYPKEEL